MPPLDPLRQADCAGGAQPHVAGGAAKVGSTDRPESELDKGPHVDCVDPRGVAHPRLVLHLALSPGKLVREKADSKSAAAVAVDGWADYRDDKVFPLPDVIKVMDVATPDEPFGELFRLIIQVLRVDLKPVQDDPFGLGLEILLMRISFGQICQFVNAACLSSLAPRSANRLHRN